MHRLKDNVIVVTGAASGLGRELVNVLTAGKANVIAADMNETGLDRLGKEMGKAKGVLRLHKGDITDEGFVTRLYDKTYSEFGRIDTLINNAGIDRTKPVHEMSIAEFRRVIEVNLNAPFMLSKLVWPYMKDRKRGHIINIASTAAKRTWPNASAYHASKWGLVGMSHALLTEGRPLGIKVSAFILGGMRTPFLLERFPDIPLSKLQDPANVAEAVRFVLEQKDETIIPELMILPMQETSWP